MTTYSLQQDGDDFEKDYWNNFLSSEFTEYADFWLKHVVPLTNRPANIHFKDDAALAAGGFTHEDICIAQLHYSILRHLARVYEIKQQTHPNIDVITEVFVRLTGAQDIAFELLERYTNKGTYDPWLSTRQGRQQGSREARQNWQNIHGHPLQDIRNYRNHLVHGRLLPGVITDTYYFPTTGQETNYFDWRVITSSTSWRAKIGVSLQPSINILREAWDKTIHYLRVEWNNHLLP